MFECVCVGGGVRERGAVILHQHGAPGDARRGTDECDQSAEARGRRQAGSGKAAGTAPGTTNRLAEAKSAAGGGVLSERRSSSWAASATTQAPIEWPKKAYGGPSL